MQVSDRSKENAVHVARHYDLLIDEENDPCNDPPELQAYMDLWDGPTFLAQLQLAPHKRVLEIGVGTGRLARQVAPQCMHFTGIDISAKTIRRAAEHLRPYPNVSLICGDFLTHAFVETFDVVYASLTMMHFLDKELTLRKAASLLAPGGILCLSIDKQAEEWIDMGTRRLRIYPDRLEAMLAHISAVGMNVLNTCETPLAHIIVCGR